MNELSRMDRHRSRNKGRKKDNKAESNGKAFRSTNTKESKAQRIRPRSGANIQSDPFQIETREVNELRRVRSKGYRDEEHDQSVPSRANTYPSHRVRMSKLFVNSLIITFILLMAGLLIWGLIGAPPLEEIL